MGSCKAQQRANQKFYLTFGSCFKSTNVDLKFNKLVKLNVKELTSDFSAGVVLNQRIVFDGNMLKYILSNEEISSQRLLIPNNQLLLEVESSGIIKTFNINLRNGIYVYLENCGPNKSLEIKQYKNPPMVE